MTTEQAQLSAYSSSFDTNTRTWMSDWESSEPTHPEAANHPLAHWEGCTLQSNRCQWVAFQSSTRWWLSFTHQNAKQELLEGKARPAHPQTSNPALAGSCSARGTTPGKPYGHSGSQCSIKAIHYEVHKTPHGAAPSTQCWQPSLLPIKPFSLQTTPSRSSVQLKKIQVLPWRNKLTIEIQ